MKFTTIFALAALLTSAEGLALSSKLHSHSKAEAEAEKWKFNKDRALKRFNQAKEWAAKKAAEVKSTADATKAALETGDYNAAI